MCVTWDDPGDARWLVVVEPDLGYRVGAKVTPAAWFDGGGHQVQGAPPLEPVKSEHLGEKAELPGSGGIRSSQGDGEGAERDQMTSGRSP